MSVLYSGATEPSYCTGPLAVSGTPAEITGTAEYEAYPYTASDGLNGTPVSKPIRYAEVVALSPSGSIVQCGETAADGTFSLNLPTSTSTYTILIRSRGNNTSVKASVLNCPEENKPYKISSTVVPDSDKDIGTVTATVTGEVLGGAFNIFDQIVEANDFLRAQVDGTCGFTPCPTAFSVADKVTAYWKLGFNPNYYNGSSSPVSFYITGFDRMFIMGGDGGAYLNEDTDHFDNSVIIHEYGHFIEDKYTESDSPGGFHSGNGLIDPRLAWSEAWGNFFQAAVRGQADYLDSDGHPPNNSDYSLQIGVEDYESYGVACAPGSSVSGCDESENAGEGNFREFTITRMLWDLFDSASLDSDGDAVDNVFKEIWQIMTSTSGFLKSTVAFRNVGLLHEMQSSLLTGAEDWSSVQTAHFQTDTSEYATYVEPGTCGEVFSMTPDASAELLWLNSIDSFYYRHPGGTATFGLSYTPSTATVPDLDLYVFNENGRITSAADLLGVSVNDAPDDESLTITNLQVGNYLIIVFGAVAGDEADYKLTVKVGSNPVEDLCPAGLP